MALPEFTGVSKNYLKQQVELSLLPLYRLAKNTDADSELQALQAVVDEITARVSEIKAAAKAAKGK